MTYPLLRIRYCQLLRIIKEGGLGSILLPFFIAGLVKAAYVGYYQEDHAIAITGILLLLCVSLQLSRKDKSFVRLHVSGWHRQMYLEYVLLTIPFAITALFTKQYYHFPLLLLILFFVPRLHINRPKVTLIPNLSKLLNPSDSIEWIAGIRASIYTLLPIYLLAIAGSFVRILPLILLWLMTATIINFYNEFEDVQSLRAIHQNARKFLHHKMLVHAKRIIFLYSPILIVNAIFNPSFIDINILFMLVQVALIIFAINMKYSSYVPATKNNTANSIVSLMVMSAVVPYLLPLPLIFAFIYYKKAIRNLNQYFHD